jgi:hypothetical protein
MRTAATLLAGATWALGRLWLVVVSGDQTQVPAHVPLDVRGEHAAPGIGALPGPQAAADGTKVQVDWVHGAEGPFRLF